MSHLKRQCHPLRIRYAHNKPIFGICRKRSESQHSDYKNVHIFTFSAAEKTQPRSQGFSLFVIGKAGKGPGTGRSHDFQHPDILGVINYNNNELENPRWPPT